MVTLNPNMGLQGPKVVEHGAPIILSVNVVASVIFWVL